MRVRGTTRFSDLGGARWDVDVALDDQRESALFNYPGAPPLCPAERQRRIPTELLRYAQHCHASTVNACAYSLPAPSRPAARAAFA